MSKEEKMIRRIKEEIEAAKKQFAETKEFNQMNHIKISAMIEMLEIETDKKYYFDEEGLKERI